MRSNKVHDDSALSAERAAHQRAYALTPCGQLDVLYPRAYALTPGALLDAWRRLADPTAPRASTLEEIDAAIPAMLDRDADPHRLWRLRDALTEGASSKACANALVDVHLLGTPYAGPSQTDVRERTEVAFLRRLLAA